MVNSRKLISVVFTLLALSWEAFAVAESDEELLLVVEVSRHGARSPTKLYKYAVNEAENFKNKSQLTIFGRQ